jgi:hypothetical protein
MYERDKNATVAPDHKEIERGIPMRPSSYGPYLGNFKATPIPGLDNANVSNPSAPVEIFNAVKNSDKATLISTGKIGYGSLGNRGKFAVKVMGTKNGRYNNYVDYGDLHQALDIQDSIIIQFDPPLQRHRVYEFNLVTKADVTVNSTTTPNVNVNWFVAWVGSNHVSATGVRYNAGYDSSAWFIMRPDARIGSIINLYARGVGTKYN